MRRTHVDLFSGIGGFSLACEWAGVETIAFAETDSYASRVLQRHWPSIPNYGDVRGFPKLSAWLLTAGVPCQPASVAGKRRGADDDRWLWPEALAVVENGSYEWLLFENPTGILSLNDGVEFERICAALEGQGYEVQPLVIPACGVGALHRRNRVWILAHSKHFRRSGAEVSGSTGARVDASARKGGTEQLKRSGGGERRAEDLADPLCERSSSERNGQRQQGGFGQRSPNVAHANDTGSQGWAAQSECGNKQFVGPRSLVGNTAGKRLPNWTGGEMGQPSPLTEFERPNGREVERNFRGVAHGVFRRVDRLKCLGNAIVPQIAYQLIKRMIEAEEQ